MPNGATDTLSSIFGGSLRHLSQEAGSGFTDPVPDLWAGSLPFTVAIIVSVLTAVTLLADFLNTIQSMLGSYVRWKECLNLYDSLSIRRSRDKLLTMFILPAILLIARNSLFPAFIGGSPGMRILSATIVLAAFFLLRFLSRTVFRLKRTPRAIFDCAWTTGRTFFIGGTLVAIALVWSLRVFGVSQENIRIALLVEIALNYTVFLIRKTEIFFNRCGIFEGILYLCTLEFIPTGLLVGATYIL